MDIAKARKTEYKARMPYILSFFISKTLLLQCKHKGGTTYEKKKYYSAIYY